MLKTRITKNDRLLMRGLYAIGIEPIKIDRSLQVRDGTTIKEVESKPPRNILTRITLTAVKGKSTFDKYMDEVSQRAGYGSFNEVTRITREYTEYTPNDTKIPQWVDDYPCLERTVDELHDDTLYQKTTSRLEDRGLKNFKPSKEIGLMRALYVAGESLEKIAILFFNAPLSVRREIIAPKAREYPKTKQGMLEAAYKLGKRLSQYFNDIATDNGYKSFDEVRGLLDKNAD